VPDNLKRIMVEVASAEEINDAQSEIETLLRQRRHVRPGATDDFQVRNMATAAISLIVGGIGIMNIMLVSVTERTKEIGLRMAVGARRRDILSQFLIEAVTLCLTGGLIGLVIGASSALAFANWGAWPIALSPALVLIALAVAALVGVFFGYYPARRASLMNPIDAFALRVTGSGSCGLVGPGFNSRQPRTRTMPSLAFDPLIAAAVLVATALTDAIYVMFTNAVLRRKRFPAAAWSSVWYMLSSFAVISYTHHWVYVVFAAAGSFIGAFVTMTFLHPGAVYPTQPPGSALQ
jgi:hypothetical protein